MAEITARGGNRRQNGGMFRFVTPHRTGKWYPDLATAQRHATAIGAGYLDARSGQFFQYAVTRLEVDAPGQDEAAPEKAA